MPTESNSTNLALRYPTSGNNGSNFAGGIADLASDVDTVVAGALNDILGPGVATPAAGAVANIAVSGAGAVSGTGLAAGNAYLVKSSGVLVRNVIPTGSFSATPSLPASGKYATVGVDLVATTWGSTASVVLSAKGTDQNTAALAAANSPAVATGHFRLMDVVILNTSGTYSLATSLDRRLRIRGASAVLLGQTSGDYGTTSSSLGVIDATNLQVRLECTGNPLRIEMDFHHAANLASGAVNGLIDILLDGTTELDGRQWVIPQPPTSLQLVARTIGYTTTAVTAGSHLFAPRYACTAGTEFYIGGSAIASQFRFSIRELAATATNGTA